MKFLLLLASLSLSLGAAVPNPATAEEKKAAADVERALDLDDVVHSVTVKEQTYTVRATTSWSTRSRRCSVPRPS